MLTWIFFIQLNVSLTWIFFLFRLVENGEERKLLNIKAACHGVELKLMEDTIGFGSVVINSKFTKTV